MIYPVDLTQLTDVEDTFKKVVKIKIQHIKGKSK